MCKRSRTNGSTAPLLTHVVCDDGEWFQVGFPDVLRQRVCILLKTTQQMSRAALRLLDLLPVLLVGRIQYGASSSHQVLITEESNTDFDGTFQRFIPIKESRQ